QRRHQKLVEESPSPAVTPELRAAMGEAAVRAARAVGYMNAGTVEFLLDEDGNFYFLEMNTRIQVEHPVTEMVTGIDLVKQQILIAAGQPLPWKQEDIAWNGHAIECRINAEIPDRNFMPSPGRITLLHAPGGPGVRFDSGVYSGALVSPYYDPMFAKLIVHGRDRAEAIARCRAALHDLVVEGIQTNIEFHLKLMDDEAFQRGELSTDFIERRRLLSASEQGMEAIHVSNAAERSDLGEIRIANEVVSIVAGLAATEVEGVAGMSGGIASGVAEMLGRKN